MYFQGGTSLSLLSFVILPILMSQQYIGHKKNRRPKRKSCSHFNCHDFPTLGCVFAELMLGQPIFPGDSGVDQLVEIIKVLGTPTREQVRKDEFKCLAMMTFQLFIYRISDQRDEPELHRVQVPPDQGAPVAEGIQSAHVARGHRPRVPSARVHALGQDYAYAGLRAHIL
jgi:hypothetical protein